MSDNQVLSELPGDEDAMWGLQGDLEWRNTWSRVIAYAWMNEDNFKEVINNPIPVMHRVSNYLPPNGLFIKVQGVVSGEMVTTPNENLGIYKEVDGELVRFSINPDPNYSFREGDVAHGVNGWERMQNNLPTEVTMTLPPRPEENFESFALADYQATGKTFPFTC